jgi:hypothetical protein
MSTPAKRPPDLADPSSFAAPNQDLSPVPEEQSDRRIEKGFQSASDDKISKAFNENRFHHRPSYELSESFPAIESRSAQIYWWLPTLALAFVGILYIFLGDDLRFPLASAGSLYLAQKRDERINYDVAKLIVYEATPSPMDQPVPLGVSVYNANDLHILKFSGLPKGTTFSAGISDVDDGWLLFATDSKDAVIRPPPHFVGVMELTVSLIFGAGNDASEIRPLRFEWVAERVAEIMRPEETRPEAKVPSETPSAAKFQDAAPPLATVQDEAPAATKSRSQTIGQLSPEETAALLKRGNDLVLSGDIAAARLVLRRAAEAGNARAAFALAGTYNPITLEKLQVHGLSPDLAVARRWYEKAKELGSPDALRELQILTVRRN